MRKLIKLLWFLSLIGSFVGLLYTYASLPERVDYMETESVDRETLFYLSLFFLAVTNFGIYAAAQYFGKNSGTGSGSLVVMVTSWGYGFSIALNIFCMASLTFLNHYNGAEDVNLDYFGYLLYFSLFLICILVLAFPLMVALGRKNLIKV